jgi:hypothetical protein
LADGSGPDRTLLEVGLVSDDEETMVVIHKSLRWSPMPKSYEEIIKHADELADRFENYEPKAGDDERASALARLQLAALRRAAVEREVARAVRDAKNAGLMSDAVGRALGSSGDAARQGCERAWPPYAPST